ncbi:Bax inhibitor-1/YccA family protein [Campylobacter jejuni]|uniref:Bax inhibitor-1/YccA family protein n=1 Tax=Campylobacter jejuni TaxID=197 RepID=UPI00070777A8|nr:Bax inhibitor-1/YccA family protein [Campylobacter jejuni]KQH37967.1 membrane protein [Campylobacter jejuni]
MEELTKEQRQIIEEEIKKEIKKADTFLKPESINKIIQDIIGNIKGNFKYPKNLEEILSSIPQKVYVSLGKEEIKQILKLDFCCFVDNVFYIDFAPKIEPYEHNQNKTAIEEQRIIQCSYDDLLYLFKTYPLIFNHCIFDYKIDKKTPIEQIKKLSFLNCNFKKEIYLHFQECLDIFQMDNCVFEDRVTIKGKFNDNVYFNNSIFKNYANFHTCEFEKIACFYGVKFYKTPNFSACYFKEPKAVNLINVDIDKLDFKSVEKYIEDNYQDESYKNETKGIQDEKEIFKIQNEHQLRYAKNLKDSFRVIKDILITQNNTLEAQEWHKLELYAKEKELLFEVESCYKEKNKPFIATKSEDKNSINLTFSVLLLWIYRVTSLHHTNLPRIINFASLNIVAFGGLVCLITYLSYRIDKQNILWFFGVLIFSVLVMAIVYLTLKKHKLKSIKLILFTFLAFLMALFLIQSIILLHSFSDVVFALFLYCLLVIALICLYPYINLKSFISYCFHWLVYFFLVMVVVIKPQLINPFAGIFSSDKLYESQFEKSLNDLNVSAIMILTDISQDNFNLPSKDQNISFVELNSAKALIIANKEKLKEILSKVYNDKYVSDYKKVLNELENNTSNVKNIIEEIDNKNNNSVISVQLNQILNFNFSQEIDILYMIKSNFFISEKLSPEQMAIFDQKDSQDKLKSVLALLKFKSSFEGILKIINQDEITENTIKSTSVLYSIMLLLCIFSLQKTARKNSIVPS